MCLCVIWHSIPQCKGNTPSNCFMWIVIELWWNKNRNVKSWVNKMNNYTPQREIFSFSYLGWTPCFKGLMWTSMLQHAEVFPADRMTPPSCWGSHHGAASCRVPPEVERALVTGHIIPGCWQGERGQPRCQGREGTEEVTGLGGGGMRRNGAPFIGLSLEWQAAQLWHWWCIPAHVGLSPHRQGWKDSHRNAVEGRPSTQNSVYPWF